MPGVAELKFMLHHKVPLCGGGKLAGAIKVTTLYIKAACVLDPVGRFILNTGEQSKPVSSRGQSQAGYVNPHRVELWRHLGKVIPAEMSRKDKDSLLQMIIDADGDAYIFEQAILNIRNLQFEDGIGTTGQCLNRLPRSVQNSKPFKTHDP